jgi:hypothetical protein
MSLVGGLLLFANIYVGIIGLKYLVFKYGSWDIGSIFWKLYSIDIILISN